MKAFNLDGKNAVVIGAGSGIGEAVASGLSSAGAAVDCIDVDRDSAHRVAESIRAQGGEAGFDEVDVREEDAVDGLFSKLIDSRRHIDIVASTPGVNVRKTLLDYRSEDFDRVIAVNLKGGFNVLRAAGRIMSRQGSGSIMLFSSIRSVTVEPGQGVYAATKAGIVQMVRTMASELGPKGVRVNAIAPGVVDTPLTEPIKSDHDWYQAYASKSMLGRWASAEEMAGPAVFLASDASSYVTGSVLFVDGGWTAADGRFQPPGMAG